MNPNDAFEAALKFTLEAEGGYTVDQGGPTNHGVTQHTYSSWLAKKGLPDKSVTSITAQEVHDLYFDGFWTEPKFDALSEQVSPLLAIVLFDSGMNESPERAIKQLQRIVCPDAIDGVLGPNTLGLSRKAIVIDGKDLPTLCIQERLAYDQRLAAVDPKKYGPDIKGWQNRLIRLGSYIQSLTVPPVNNGGLHG